MAVDIFLKIDDVKGESAVKGHEASMEILSWSWGMTQSGSSHTGGGIPITWNIAANAEK